MSVPQTSRLQDSSSISGELSTTSTLHAPGKAPSSSLSDKPTLVRTSQVGLNKISNSESGTYSTYQKPATLKIKDDLEKIAKGWSQEEKSAKRRLVRFSREQAGTIITTSFKSVTLEKKAPNNICVSCIWWSKKQETFITSVDIIYLLELLIAIPFTLKERDRIRSNLKVFRHLTISKFNADDKSLYELIMAFPSPKPRNIDKNIKVFPWKILGAILKRIISKYSATYTSALPPQGQNIAMSRSECRAILPKTIAPPAQYPTYWTTSDIWTHSQDSCQNSAYGLIGSWTLGQYAEPASSRILPAEDTYEQHMSTQSQPRSTYASIDQIYMPYGHSSFQL